MSSTAIPATRGTGRRFRAMHSSNGSTTSRSPFPDLHFDIVETIADGDRVAIAWMMRGTQTGPLGDRPASGRAINVHGMTIYYFLDGRITGHRQIVDRIGVARQLGLMG